MRKWRYGIMLDLKEMGLKNRLSTFLGLFWTNRSYKTQIGSTLLDTKVHWESPKGA